MGCKSQRAGGRKRIYSSTAPPCSLIAQRWILANCGAMRLAMPRAIRNLRLFLIDTDTLSALGKPLVQATSKLLSQQRTGGAKLDHFKCRPVAD
jgi:hypothetical protein